MLHFPHWSFEEMRLAFGYSLEQYLYFGGYPGAAPFSGDPARWCRYILDALVEATISRDVLLLNRVDKPALLRRLYALGREYSGQICSIITRCSGSSRMPGTQPRSRITLISSPPRGLMVGLQKFAGQDVRQKASSPKLQVLNTALVTSAAGLTPEEVKADSEFYGRLAESAVGAHLANAAARGLCQLFYWRGNNREVDFVLRSGKKLAAIEIKSGRKRETLPGMEAFCAAFRPTRTILVGEQGIALRDFLLTPAEHWVE